MTNPEQRDGGFSRTRDRILAEHDPQLKGSNTMTEYTDANALDDNAIVVALRAGIVEADLRDVLMELRHLLDRGQGNAALVTLERKLADVWADSSDLSRHAQALSLDVTDFLDEDDDDEEDGAP